MNRRLFFAIAGCLAASFFGSFAAESVHARAKYSTAFRKTYVKRGTPMYAAIKGKNVCNACHVGGEKEREMLNPFGEAMSEFLPDADVMDNKVIQESLERAVKKHSAGDGTPTFAELIETGKLPFTEKVE